MRSILRVRPILPEILDSGLSAGATPLVCRGRRRGRAYAIPRFEKKPKSFIFSCKWSAGQRVQNTNLATTLRKDYKLRVLSEENFVKEAGDEG